MKNLLLIIAFLFSGLTLAQSTNVTITLKGEKDAEWMCGKTYMSNDMFTHQTVDCYNGHLFIDEQTIEINVTKPGGYCVRMKSNRYDKITMVYFQINEGDNYELFERVRGDKISIDSSF